MEIKDIRRIAEMMKANDLSEFAMKEDNFELAMKRGSNEPQVVYASPAAAPMAAAPAAAAPATASTAANETDESDGLIEIPSPIVGTFYGKPSPEAEAFVKIGSEVTVDSVVCIVEAMKVMNEIKADVKGIIKKILVEDASPVQYGQPLFLVEPK
ncbi:acetyl-CoA carboxylase biotin carboxyl carrier protein [Pontiella sp.]|uniref:acetyl-CoA carboxylase biotin carboxyl carrier protein n=1 Tax=Pontiella sp. TaxID=2837462 RepID=UPI00356AFD90